MKRLPRFPNLQLPMSRSRNEPQPFRHMMPRPALGEWLSIAAIVLLGTVLRFWLPENMAVEHFDEGVYASNIWFPTPDHYPMRHLYAPPLLPALVEWSMLLFGSAASAAMLVNLVAGLLTIPAVWWAGRTWFGITAGITAAALCAFSDFHILYCRTVLTDPLLCLWLIVAVFCLGEGHRRHSWRWLIAGGLCTGLAWWTKYNGWLPIAIQVSGVTGWMLFGGKDARRELFWHLGGWLLTGLVAGMVIAPMFLGLTDVGGYAAVAENHRGYFVGLTGWWDSFHRQFQAHRFLDGYVSVFGAAYAATWGLLLSMRRTDGRFTWNCRSKNDNANRAGPGPVSFAVLSGGVVLLCGLAAVLGTTVLLAVSTFAGFALMVTGRGRSSDSDKQSPRKHLPAWILAAWFLGLLVATPMYRAYPRISLPWLVAAWLGAGACLQCVVERLSRTAADGSKEGNPRAIPMTVGLLMLGGMFFYVGQSRFPVVRVPGWQNRSGFRPIAEEVKNLTVNDAAKSTTASVETTSSIRAAEDVKFVIYVYGEPGLFHQLCRVQQAADSPRFVVAVAPVNVARITPVKTGSSELPTFLVTGPHADRNPDFRQQWEQAGSRFRQVGRTFRYRASDLVLLNELSAEDVANPDRRPQLAVRLFRVK